MINKITILLTFFFLSIFSFAQETNIVEGELLVLLNKEISVEYFNKELNANYPQLQLSVKKVISKRLNVWLLNYNSSNVNSDLALELVNSSANTIITQFNHTQLELRGDTCSIDSSFTDQWVIIVFADELTSSMGNGEFWSIGWCCWSRYSRM